MTNEKEMEVVRKEVVGFVQQAQGLTVVTKEDYQLAVLLRNRIKEARGRWVSYWKPVKDSAYATWKGLCAKENEGTVVCDNAVQVVDGKALPWKAEADRKIAEEQARIQAIASEKARRERERLEKEAEKLKSPELKAARLEQAAAVVDPVISLESATAGVEGGGTRKLWQGTVVDMAALIAAAGPGTVAASFLEVNEKAVRAFAVSTKGKVAVSGVEFKEVVGFSGRA